MAETAGTQQSVTGGPPGIFYESDYNESATVGTSATEIISKKDDVRFNRGSLCIYNAGTGGALTAKVYVSNKESPGATYTAANGWAQLGSDISVASGANSPVQWTGSYRWVAVTGSLASSEASDVDAYMLLIHE